MGDLGDPDAPRKIADQISAKSELPDIFVANASVQFRTPWDKIPLEESLLQMQVNFHSTLMLAQLFFPVMKAQKWGRIVTIGSVQEFRPHPEMAVYAASKSAQENLVRNIARQVACEGITVNNIAPGVLRPTETTKPFRTPSTQSALPTAFRRTPTPNPPTPRELRCCCARMRAGTSRERTS